MALVPTWVWLGAGWLLAGLGVWLLVRGRPFRLRHGGRLCRRCGYSMAGVPSLKCPECGRTARSEKQLRVSRGSKRWRLTALTLLALGWLAMQAPGIISAGWKTAIPALALVALAPAEDPVTAASRAAAAGRRLPGGAPLSPPQGATWRQRLGEALYLEAWSRLQRGSLNDTLGGWYLSKALGDRAAQSNVTAPLAWPWDAPMPELDGPMSVTGPHNTQWRAVLLKPSGPRTTLDVGVKLESTFRVYPIPGWTAPVDVTRSRAEFLDGVTSPELDAAVLATLKPRLRMNATWAWIEVEDGHMPEALTDRGMVVSVRMKVLMDGVEAGRGLHHMTHRRSGAAAETVGVLWKQGYPIDVIARPQTLELEIVGDPGLATDRMLERWSGTKQRGSAWTGRLRVRVPVEKD